MKLALSYAWQNILRNKLLSLGAVFVIMLISFFFIILDSIGYMMDESIQSLGENVDFTIFLSDGVNIDDDIVLQLRSELEALPAELELLSKEDALQASETLFLPDMVEFVKAYKGGSILPASIVVRGISGQDPERILQIMKKPQYATAVDIFSDQTFFEEQAERIKSVTNVMVSTKTVFLVLYVFFIIIAFLIIFNTQRLLIYSRRDEIEVMELVGAKKQLIRKPFFFESLFFSTVGVLLGLGLFLFLLWQGATAVAVGIVNATLPTEFIIQGVIQQFVTFIQTNWLVEVLKVIGIFALVALLSTHLALRRYLPKF